MKHLRLFLLTLILYNHYDLSFSETPSKKSLTRFNLNYLKLKNHSDPLKNPLICGLASCEADNNKFEYSSNTKYKYGYESSFSSLFDGTDNPASELFITADLQLTFPTKCQGHLKVTGVMLKHSNEGSVEKPKNPDYEYENGDDSVEIETPQEIILHSRSAQFANEIAKTDIRFGFHDGLVSEICPNPDEAIWVTNFKRGIISMMQNSMQRFDLDHKATESDISGKCRVEYQFQGSTNTSIDILKIKEASSCQNRNKFKSIIQTSPYSFGNEEISWWPIYNTNSTCKVRNIQSPPKN